MHVPPTDPARALECGRTCHDIGRVSKAIALLLLILPSCSGTSSGQSAAKEAKKGAAVSVTVGTAVRQSAPVQLSVIGNVQAYSTVTVRALVEGTLTEVHFAEGQHVRKGDLLFTIDPRPFEVLLKQAEAALARDKAQAELAGQEATRYEGLAAKNYVSREQADQTRAAADAAEATLLADQAGVENARLQLDYCSIRSPIDGVAGALLVHAGNVVKANDPDHPLVVIQQVSPVYVAFSVPASQLPEVKRSMARGPVNVSAAVSDSGDYENVGGNIGGNDGNRREADGKDRDPAPAAGTLTFIDNAVDLTTGTIQLKAVFPNGNKALWPGQFVNVVLTLSTQPDAILVPTQAVQTGQEGSYLFVVGTDGTVESRPVVVGRTVQHETVIERGVSPGERVVTDGQLRLAPGVKVDVKETGAAASDAAGGKGGP
jgi:multidrug efflux system membrane fusion protein